MIESPVLDEAFDIVRGRTMRDNIVAFLESRFADVPTDLNGRLAAVEELPRLKELIRFAAKCPDLQTFLDELAG